MATLAPKLPYTHPFAGGFPYRGSARLPSDPDALTYLAAVAAADGAPVEVGVATAVDDFFKGCKADPSGTPGRSNWDAIKASCILCGARTLAGALVPLVGGAPTNVNNNFVEADYNRETGLVGNGSTKYLDSNRANDADPQDDNHNAVYVTAGSINSVELGAGSGSGANNLIQGASNAVFRNRSSVPFNSAGSTPNVGLIAASRSLSTEFVVRFGGLTETAFVASQNTYAGNVHVFRREGSSGYSSSSLAFYSIGESLDLALLDARVTALVAAIGAAL
jgi:hypothetical protein